MKIQYLQASSDQELFQILALQKANLELAISSAESQSQGFVTVDHTFELLQKMNRPYGHIIAKNKKKVIGYCLVMLPEFGAFIPVLNPLIQKIDKLVYQDKKLKESRYFIMGQVCIAKAYRGLGVFGGLYQHMQKKLSPHFDFIVTSIAIRNQRSLKAHGKIGFQVVAEYVDESGDDWAIVLWKI